MTKFVADTKNFARGEEGATMVEYGLMLSLIAIVCIVSVGTLGKNASIMFSKAATSL